MAKLAVLSQFTPVRGRSGKGLIHAFGYGDTERTVCGRKAKGWVIVPAIAGIRQVDMLTCGRCKGGCK